MCKALHSHLILELPFKIVACGVSILLERKWRQRLTNLPMTTQLGNGRAGIQKPYFFPDPTCNVSLDG